MKTRRADKIHQKAKRRNEINKQLVIRFPQDIADLIHENNYNAQLSVQFIDSNNAKCQIFDESFDAVLVSLPTIVETFRTTDGYHLFKSGEITDILLVYRQGEEPTGISSDYKYAHGITPPTTDIVVKRKSKQEAIAISHHESFLDDVEYWDLAELQITSLMSKERKLNKTRRTEIFEEPDIDPIILEKILRKNGYSAYEGYSGYEISQEEVDNFDISELENYLSNPSQYKSSSLANKPKIQYYSTNKTNNSGISDSNDGYFVDESQENFFENSNASDASGNSDTVHVSDFEEKSQELNNSENKNIDDTNDNSDDDNEQNFIFFNDEASEEEDPQEAFAKQLIRKKEMFQNDLESYKIKLITNSSNIMKEKIEKRISSLEVEIKKIDEQIESLSNE